MLQQIAFVSANRRAIPRHLRPRREKIFGPAPSHPLDGNAKARIWAAAPAYNATHREGRQHQGPLTWATLRVLKVLLWRFHSADGGGRCFPGYDRIAAAAKCCRDTVAVAIRALEEASLLTWVNRITRVRRRERDLLGAWTTDWQVIRTSNAYQLLDPLDRAPGRRGYKSENPTGPPNPKKQVEGPRLDGAEVTQARARPPPTPPPQPPPLPAERPLAPQREHTSLSVAERQAIETRMNASTATRADWQAWERDLDIRLGRNPL